MPTTLYLGADHAGWKLKEALKPKLLALGCRVQDLTPLYMPGDDYPWIGEVVAKKVSKTAQSRGVLVCGSGVGVAIAANRVKGARAVEGYDPKQVALAREHNDVNVLTLGGWKTTVATAMKLIKPFLTTKASTATRHRRRIKQLG
jgi:ribose 5-phosphate isomerase B